MRVLKLVGTGLELAARLSEGEGMSYAELYQRLGSAAAIYDFLCTIHDLIDNLNITVPQVTGERFVDNFPTLHQGGDDGDESWNGQPIVYDGGFELIEGELWFSGMSDYSGFGKPVSRKVMNYDYIFWPRCESLKYYKGEF